MKKKLSDLSGNMLALATGILFAIFIVICLEIFLLLFNRYQDRTKTITWNTPGTHMQKDRLFGYKYKPGSLAYSTKKVNGSIKDKITYTIDKYGRRGTTVEPPQGRNNYIGFLGCSVVFGLHVNDNETLPYYAGVYSPAYSPYNYGVGGYGPQQMLIRLKETAIRDEIKQRRGIFIYVFIDAHIARAAGSMKIISHWGKGMPCYIIDNNGKLIRKGDFRTVRPVRTFIYDIIGKSNIARSFKLDWPPGYPEQDILLTYRIIEDSYEAYKKDFGNDEFYVLIFPGSKFGKRLIPYLKRCGIKYLDYSGIDFRGKEFKVEGDTHPCPKAYRILAEKLTKDLGISDK